MMSQEDAVQAQGTPEKIGVRELGRLARSLDISRLGTAPKTVPGIDRDFDAAGGNLARFARASGLDPLTAAREAVDVDLMDRNDPRFAAALRMRLESREAGFVEDMTKPDRMMQAASGFAAHLRDAGDRQGFLQMKAICMTLEKGDKLDASSMSAKLEDAALSSKVPEKLRDDMLLDSARFGDAHHIQMQKSKEKTAERQDVAR